MRMGLSDRATAFALGLLDQFDGHISAKLFWKSIGGDFTSAVLLIASRFLRFTVSRTSAPLKLQRS